MAGPGRSAARRRRSEALDCALRPALAVQNRSRRFCRTLRGFSSARAVRSRRARWRSQRDMREPIPGSRPSGQRSLSKIAPGDFVEPSTRVLIPCDRILRCAQDGAPRGIRTLVPALRGLCPGPLDDGSGERNAGRTPVRIVRYYTARFFRLKRRVLLKDSNFSFESDADIGPRVVTRDQHPISRANISSNALKVLYRLKEAGFQAFLVGGAVRDLLLGLNPEGLRCRDERSSGSGEAVVSQLQADRSTFSSRACPLRLRDHRSRHVSRRAHDNG